MEAGESRHGLAQGERRDAGALDRWLRRAIAFGVGAMIVGLVLSASNDADLKRSPYQDTYDGMLISVGNTLSPPDEGGREPPEQPRAFMTRREYRELHRVPVPTITYIRKYLFRRVDDLTGPREILQAILGGLAALFAASRLGLLSRRAER
jgi:hypothetical protein